MIKKGPKSKFRSEYPVDFVFDYKDPLVMSRFLTDGGKIVPSRISKLSQYQQRKVCKAVKKSRQIGILPSGMSAYDTHGRPEGLSIKPFEF